MSGSIEEQVQTEATQTEAVERRTASTAADF